MTYILGLNAYHADAAACLVKDGTLVAAVEEERFRRIKHWGGFPSESIRYCLSEAGISLGDVEHVAVNSDNRANRWRKLGYVLTSGVSPSYVLSRLRQRGERADIAGNLKQALPDHEFRGAVHAVEHHLCHLASAFLVSPYDKAVAVSVDGFGDFSSAAWGLGEGGTSLGRRPRLLPPFARRVLRGDDAVHRLPALRRRIQGDGACPLRRAALRRPHEADREDQGRRHLRARPALLPPCLGRRAPTTR